MCWRCAPPVVSSSDPGHPVILMRSRCFGRLPPRAARCFIDLATQKENSEVIREELRAIDGMYGSNTDKDPEMPNAPLPFTLYLLACAFHANLEGSEVPIYTTMYHFDFSLLDSRMNPSEGGK